jgi:23S rRNA pseudouridine2605 synthase
MLLPRGLKRGAWMELDDFDIQALRRASAHAPGAAPAGGGRDKPRTDNGGGANRKRRRGGRGNAPARGDAPRDPMRGAGQPTGNNGGAGRNRNRNRPERDDSGERADRQAAESQPDPMKTAFGYIGADSFTKQRQGPGQRRSGGPGRGNPGGGAPGGNSGGNRRRGGRGR